jgi:hypothetical protein
MAVMLIIHGRLVYPIYGMRVDTPEAAALVVMVFYGGLHAIYLLLALAIIILSLAMKRGGSRSGSYTSGSRQLRSIFLAPIPGPSDRF